MGEHPLHVVAVTGFVSHADGRVLLVRVAGRGWELPGGQVELGETLLAALEREVEEEAGCRVEAGPLVGVYSKLTPPPMVLHLFRCRHVAGEPRPCEETPEVGWFEPEQARRLVTHEPSARRLADALRPADGRMVYRAYRLRPYAELLEHRG